MLRVSKSATPAGAGKSEESHIQTLDGRIIAVNGDDFNRITSQKVRCTYQTRSSADVIA